MTTQAELWNGPNAQRWLKLRPALTAMVAPFGDAALEKLAPARGEKALDVGCGPGDTTFLLAERTGDALGVDISAPLIEEARREARPGARFVVADAQTHAFGDRFDLLYSRFGIMFFEDPAKAFANLVSALKPGARFAAAVWGPFEENTWASVPLQILRKRYPGGTPQPGKPGPFGLSDATLVRALLADLRDVSVEPMRMRKRTDPSLLLQSGPSAAVLREAGVTSSPELEAEVAAALPDGVEAVALILSARK